MLLELCKELLNHLRLGLLDTTKCMEDFLESSLKLSWHLESLSAHRHSQVAVKSMPAQETLVKDHSIVQLQEHALDLDHFAWI